MNLTNETICYLCKEAKQINIKRSQSAAVYGNV